MTGATKIFWPTAHHFAEAIQCPALCFAEPALQDMIPAVDRLGMPLVTSGQFAYVFKLNSNAGGEAVAVRCFRGFLGDREQRYRAIDAHLAARSIAALPRFRYLPAGILVHGERYPLLAMQWVEGPTLDVYLAEVLGKPDVLWHLADEWARLVSDLRAARVAHGDLQHGNIIVERGRLRLVDLDGMFVPALEGMKASEVGHQHFQHPSRDARLFDADVDNFSALVIYLSLVALAERPALWREHHDENLLFTRRDFLDPAASALFAKIKEMGDEQRRLAEALEQAARQHDPAQTPPLAELVGVKSGLPGWMTTPPDMDVVAHTREVKRAEVFGHGTEVFKQPRVVKQSPASLPSKSVQTIFGAAAAKQGADPPDPADISGNTLWYAKKAFGGSYSWVWWIPLHNVIFTHLWGAFYVTGFPALLATLVFMVAAYFVYGFLRAFYLLETATLNAPTPVGHLHSSQRTASMAAPHARQDLFGATLPTPATDTGHYAPALSASVKPVVGNRSLMIYHLPGCEWVAKISARRREEFLSPDAAQIEGFRPCRVCAP
jgi:hypothetical protein